MLRPASCTEVALRRICVCVCGLCRVLLRRSCVALRCAAFKPFQVASVMSQVVSSLVPSRPSARTVASRVVSVASVASQKSSFIAFGDAASLVLASLKKNIEASNRDLASNGPNRA